MREIVSMCIVHKYISVMQLRVQHKYLLSNMHGYIFESPRENWAEVFVVCIKNKEANRPNSNTDVTNPGYSIDIKRRICL